MKFKVELKGKNKYELYVLLKSLPEGTFDLSDLEKEVNLDTGISSLQKINRLRILDHVKSIIDRAVKENDYLVYDAHGRTRFFQFLSSYLEELKIRRAFKSFTIVDDDSINPPSYLDIPQRKVEIWFTDFDSPTQYCLSLYIKLH